MEKQRKVRCTATAIFLVLALLVGAVAMILLYGVYDSYLDVEASADDEDGNAGEALGFAFAAILLLAPSLLGGIGSLVLDMIALLCAVRLFKRSEGKRHTFSVAAIVVSVFLFAALLFSYPFVLISI